MFQLAPSLLLLLLSLLYLNTSAVDEDSNLCGFPGVPGLYGSFDLPSGNFKPGQNVSYVCPEGLATVGPTQRTCLENGTWSSVIPQCVPKLVDRVLEICRDMKSFEIHFPRGVYPKKVMIHGLEKVTFGVPHEHVFKEFDVDPDDENIVNHNLSSPLTVCSYQVYGWLDNLACGLPEVPANAISRLDSAREKVNYSCSAGYELVGPDVRVCTGKRMWGDNQASCQKIPIIDHQLLVDSEYKYRFWEGSILFFGAFNAILWLVVIVMLISQRRQKQTNYHFWLRGGALRSSESVEPLCLSIEGADQVTKIKELDEEACPTDEAAS